MKSKRRKQAYTQSTNGAGSRTHKGLQLTLLIIVVVCLCFAWARPLRNVITRRLWPSPSPSPRDAYEFIAIAYTQPARSRSGNEDQQRAPFYEHLDALVANGYVPLTLNDVNLLLRRGRPLPRNGILLTTDIDNTALLHDIRSAVWRYGWHGVAFVDTASLSAANGDTLDWTAIQKLDSSSNWEAGLSGHLATAGIPANKIYGRGQFLSSRMWIASEQRFETHAEFKKRIELDYQTALQLASEKLGNEPIAYAYPFGDFGQYTPNDFMASEVNLNAADDNFALAFTLGAVGRNTMFSDPKRLNRMEVNPNWSGSEFIEAIKVANRPIEQVEDVDMARRATGWYASRGQFKVDKYGLTLEPAPASGEGSIWLAGSDVRRDFSATIDFVLYDGVAEFYARAEPDRSAYLVVAFDGQGNAVLKQKTALQEAPFTLARARAPVRKGKQHALTFYMRDSNINIGLDGITVFNTHKQTTGVKRSGLFGAAVHTGSANGDAGLMITDIRLERRQSTLASWQFDAALDPYAVSWIQDHGSRLTEISPPIQRLQDGGPYRSDQQQPHIFRRLSSLYKLRLVPGLQITSREDLENWSPVALAGTLSDLDCDGVYVNFEQYDQFNIKELEQWLRQTSKMLSGAGRPVLVRLPRMLERLSAVYSLLAVIPSVEVVTDSNTKIGVNSLQSRQIHEEPIARPTPDQINALPPVYTIDEAETAPPEQTIERRIRELIDDGETAFRRGIYESAIAAFAEWHRLAPASPAPPRRIGDALTNIGYHDEAASFYRQSLDLNPAQIDLATRYARLLREIGRKVEARGLLNTYARLFPDNSDILLAQAEWLYSENRIAEARKRAQRVLLLEPTHFDATLFMLRIAANESERTAAIEDLMAVSKTAEHHHQLVSAIWQYDLLTYQNSHLFISIMDKIANENDDPRIQNMLAQIDPLDKTVTAEFKSLADLTQYWKFEGATANIQNDMLTVEAEPSRTELSVRLLRSERWRDSFIEASVEAVNGGFWLYARRSRDHLIRFGFDAGSDRLNLQIWQGRNNNVVASQHIPWTKPEGRITIRLEVRGKGAIAYLDGQPAFDVPLALPADFGLGWTAFVAQSADRGQANATLSHLASGPIPLGLAMMPDSPADDNKGEQTTRLRKLLPVLTDVSPDWFTIDPSGSWTSQVNAESNFYQLFARYYRLRLTPQVRIRSGAEITADDIITVCRTHEFDGLVLQFDRMPDDAWFEAMDRDLTTPGLDVVAIAGNRGGSTIRGIASSRTLFKKHSGSVPLNIVDVSRAMPDIENPKQPDAVGYRF